MWRPSFGGLWRDRRFLTFWSAQTVSEFGDRITELALPLIAVTMLNATPAEVGLLTAAVWLPNLLSLVIGSWVEQRPDKRPLMVAADLFRLVVLLSLPLAFWFGALTLTQLYVIALLCGAARATFDTAYAAFFVRLVPMEDYLEANSKLAGTRSLSYMAGPAVGGILVQVLTAPIAILGDALTFVLSAIQIGRLKIAPAPPEKTDEPLFKRALEGMRYLLTHPYLSGSVACSTTVNFFNLMGSSLLILYASRYLELWPRAHRHRAGHWRERGHPWRHLCYTTDQSNWGWTARGDFGRRLSSLGRHCCPGVRTDLVARGRVRVCRVRREFLGNVPGHSADGPGRERDG